MRRNDREVTDINKILEIVDDCQIMRIGLSCPEGAYIVPMHFGYEYQEESGNVLFYLHSAREGRKVEMIHACPTVGFEMDCLDEMIERETPCAWSAHFRSVMGTGTMHLLETDEEKCRGLDILMHHYGMTGKGEYSAAMLERTAVWVLEVKEISGKQNQ